MDGGILAVDDSSNIKDAKKSLWLISIHRISVMIPIPTSHILRIPASNLSENLSSESV
jgi:hypothetical protein